MLLQSQYSSELVEIKLGFVWLRTKCRNILLHFKSLKGPRKLEQAYLWRSILTLSTDQGNYLRDTFFLVLHNINDFLEINLDCLWPYVGLSEGFCFSLISYLGIRIPCWQWLSHAWFCYFSLSVKCLWEPVSVLLWNGRVICPRPYEFCRECKSFRIYTCLINFNTSCNNEVWNTSLSDMQKRYIPKEHWMFLLFEEK